MAWRVKHRLDALVTIGTFSRLRAVAPRLARAFIGDRYDNLVAVPTLDEPFTLIHGRADVVVPATEGKLLYTAARTAGRAGAAFVVDGAGHNPNGETIAAILDVVTQELQQPATPALALPAGVERHGFR